MIKRYAGDEVVVEVEHVPETALIYGEFTDVEAMVNNVESLQSNDGPSSLSAIDLAWACPLCQLCSSSGRLHSTNDV